jgi:hypothetical protein
MAGIFLVRIRLLQNLDLLDSVLLYLGEADSQYAVFQYGFDLFFLDWYWQSDGT